MNDTIDVLLRHRSIRLYTDEPVLEADIRRAVQAGQAASTSAAVQAYCMIRVRDEARRGRLAELSGGQEKVTLAGAFFVICADMRRLRLFARRDGIPHETRLEGFLKAVIDAALFAQNAVVAFEAMGYGICYIGGLRNDLPAADELLELPEGVFPLFGLCVGRPAEDPLPRPRLPVEAVLLEESYPSDEAMLALTDECDGRYRGYLEARGAEAKDWSALMAAKHAVPVRTEVGTYYRSKGADLS